MIFFFKLLLQPLLPLQYMEALKIGKGIMGELIVCVFVDILMHPLCFSPCTSLGYFAEQILTMTVMMLLPAE